MSSHPKSKTLFAAGALVLTVAAAGIVVLAALTTWWALFALLALCPLLMLACGAAMMTATSGFCSVGPCAAWPEGRSGRSRA